MKKLFIILIILIALVWAAGATTMVFNTAGSNDGYVGITHSTGSHTFSQLRTHVGNYVDTTAVTARSEAATGTDITPNFTKIYVAYIEFDTSALPDTAIVDSAILGLTAHATTSSNVGAMVVGITRFNPLTNGTAVAGDYQNISRDYLSDTQYTTAQWSIAAHNFSINSAGILNISKTAYTNYAFGSVWYITGNETGLTWANNAQSDLMFQTAEHGGGPFLEVTYHVPDVIPPASITNLANSSSCNSINWSWVNPPDADFNLTRVYQNGTFLHNVTTPYDNWTGLVTGLLYEIGTSTCDITGNCNATFRNASAFPSCVLFPPSASFVSNVTCGNVPFVVQFNDTSLNSPTAWNWSSFNSENLINFSEQQNPIFGYNVSGLFTINFNATNVQGTNWSNGPDYIRAVPNWAVCPPMPTSAPTWTLPIMPSTEVDVQPGSLLSYWWVAVGLLLVVFLVMRK